MSHQPGSGLQTPYDINALDCAIDCCAEPLGWIDLAVTSDALVYCDNCADRIDSRFEAVWCAKCAKHLGKLDTELSDETPLLYCEGCAEEMWG